MRDDGSGRWYGEAASDELWGLLGRLEAAAHVLIEVRPVLNLESAFMQYVRGGVTA
jgi:hypothetical protein